MRGFTADMGTPVDSTSSNQQQILRQMIHTYVDANDRGAICLNSMFSGASLEELGIWTTAYSTKLQKSLGSSAKLSIISANNSSNGG